MKHSCYYCGKLKECQSIRGKDNELKAGYMSKESVKVRYVCKECIIKAKDRFLINI